MMKKTALFCLIAICIVLLCACSAAGQYFLFGTFIDIKIEGKGAYKAEKQIKEELERLDNLFSPDKPESDIYKINKAKAGEQISVSVDTLNALRVCKEVFELSGGAFDPTVFPLVKLWKFSPDTFRGLSEAPPKKSEITRLMNFVGFDKMLTIDFENGYVTKTYDEVQIDFGGVAKGYAAQVSAKIASGKQALLNLGGNIACVGKTYKIGIANPRESVSPYFGSLSVDDSFSISTSGDYERYYEYEGKRYHHIINPFTGYPSGFDENGNEVSGKLISATIISNNHAKCDAVATAVLILGKEAGRELLQNLNLKAILIDSELNHKVVGDFEFEKYGG